MKGRPVSHLAQRFGFGTEAITLEREKIRDRLQGMIDDDNILEAIFNEIAEVRLAVSEIHRQLGLFEHFLQARDILLPQLSLDPKEGGNPSQLSIHADQRLREENGFYILEHDAKGNPFRWSGPDPRFGFDVFLDRHEPLTMELYVVDAMLPEMVPRMRAFVNQEEVALQVADAQHGWLMSATIPESETSGRTRISFLLPSVCSPRKLNSESTDDRYLGIAFSKLTLRPQLHSSDAEKVVRRTKLAESLKRRSR